MKNKKALCNKSETSSKTTNQPQKTLQTSKTTSARQTPASTTKNETWTDWRPTTKTSSSASINRAKRFPDSSTCEMPETLIFRVILYVSQTCAEIWKTTLQEFNICRRSTTRKPRIRRSWRTRSTLLPQRRRGRRTTCSSWTRSSRTRSKPTKSWDISRLICTSRMKVSITVVKILKLCLHRPSIPRKNLNASRRTLLTTLNRCNIRTQRILGSRKNSKLKLRPWTSTWISSISRTMNCPLSSKSSLRLMKSSAAAWTEGIKLSQSDTKLMKQSRNRWQRLNVANRQNVDPGEDDFLCFYYFMWII